MSKWVEAVKQVYTQRLKAHYLKQYKAYCQNREPSDRFEFSKENLLGEEAIAELPKPVQQLWQAALDEGDRYYPKVYQLAIEGQPTYAVRVTTDGDDGWLTLFDAEGQILAAARTYIEVILWDKSEGLRSSLPLLEATPPGFEAAQLQTLWGRPLEELEAEGTSSN